MSNNFGLIAANTSRTRAYLAALERHELLPCWVLLLDDGSLESTAGQSSESVMRPGLSGLVSAQGCWSEIDFDPAAPLIPMLERLNLSFKVVASRDINDPTVIQEISQCEPSVLIYSGYGGALLRKEALTSGKRFLHVHGGFLPEFKGSTTNYYSLLSDNTLGASAIFLTADIDCGPILARQAFPPPKDLKLIDHIYDSAARARVLVDTLSAFNQSGDWKVELPENIGGDTYYIIHPVLKHIAILGKRI